MRSCDSIDCFAAARRATTTCCVDLAFASSSWLRLIAVRNVRTWCRTFASSDVTLFALSMRLIMSSRLLAPRITSSVEV